MLERWRSALGGLELARQAGRAESSPDIVVRERWPLAMVQITALDGPDGAVPALRSELGLELPAPGASTASADISILWCGPSRWLVVGARAANAGLASALARAAPALAVVDLSHARTVLRLSGCRVRDVLAKICAVDLHPRAFALGGCAATVFARLPALVHLVNDTPTFDIYVPRTFARESWDGFVAAAAEFGCDLQHAQAV